MENKIALEILEKWFPTPEGVDETYHIVQAMEEYAALNAPTGPRWVKAKPTTNGFYAVKFAGGGYGGCGFKDGKWNQSLNDNLIVAYLDESTPAGSEEGTDVFVPCAEDDPDRCGGYTSDDGRSLCYVKVQHLPVSALKQKEGK